MGIKTMLGAMVVSVAALSAVPASAATYTLTGATTLASPTYNRPLAGTPPTGLSAVGTAVHYNTLSFTVSAAGSYDFLMNSGTGGFDTFLGLYSGAFNPASPLTNAITYNDDFGSSLTSSGFTSALTAGTSYIAVLTGFSNTDVGAYTLTINGPGTVTPRVSAVPEPVSWAMMLFGVGLMGTALRYRRRTTRITYA